MEKLSGVRVSGEWARALVACVDVVPVRASRVSAGRVWVWGVLAIVSVGAGVLWLLVFFH
jgi:hypothetical protein